MNVYIYRYVYIDQHALIHAHTCRHPQPLQYVRNLRESCPTCTNESCVCVHTRRLPVGSYFFASKQNREVKQGRQPGTHGVYYASCIRVSIMHRA